MADKSIDLTIPSLRLTPLDSPEVKTPKRKKRGKSSSSIESTRVGPDGDSVIIKQKFGPLPPGIKKPSPQKKSQNELRKTPKKGASSPRKTRSTKAQEDKEVDETWEKAVEVARGMPEGAVSSDEENMPEEEEDVDSDGESSRKKSCSVLQKAAKQIKKLKENAENGVAGKKRKREESGTSKESPKKKKLEHMTKKERKKLRKKQGGEVFDVSEKSKEMWESLRRFDLPPEEREQISQELHGLIKGKAKKLIYAHDTSRVIQCLLKYGSQTEKNALFEELKDDLLNLMRSKYAKYFVRRLLKYGTMEQKAHVMLQMRGQVCKLIRHAEAGEIVECAFNDYANASERNAMIEDFYGPCYKLYKTSDHATLKEIVANHPDKLDMILRNMKETLTALIDKNILQHSIVHHVFLEFFTYATAERRSDMIELLRESAIHMLHTREGARVAMLCVWHGTAKDRKLMVRSFKTYVTKICREEYGHLVLLAMFDSIDDTKLVVKFIIDEMLKNLVEVIKNPFGRKVILYLLRPRDPMHFHPDVVKILAQGDGNAHSKKDTELRRRELLEPISRPLIQHVAQHCKEIITDNAALLTYLSIITNAKTDPTLAMKAMAAIAGEPFTAGSLENTHIVDHNAGHLALKKLIMNDVERIKAGEKVLFSCILLDDLPEGALKSWAACNRGCFILTCLLEVGHAEVSAKVREELATIKSSLSKMNFKGAQVLLKKLNEG